MRVLVTGGSGAFGSAFVRAALTWPYTERVAVYSRDEHKHERLMRELGPDPQDRLRFFLGDVRDLRRLTQAMHGCTHVVHAAALKVVPMLEYSPTEGVRTNVDGACNVVDAAIAAGVQRVVGISTDKAVGPLNLYGATKLAAEKLFLAANALAGGRTSFGVVRYGNVTGSTGSVVPAWRAQAEDGGPLTLTDERMTRYWMTLDEAVELVREALASGRPNVVTVPKLPSYRVTDLAAAIWQEVCGEDRPRTRTIGIRPGEKLHEVLVSADEAPWCYDCGTHYEVLHATNSVGPGGTQSQPNSPGTAVDRDFCYRSNENDEWLNTTQLRRMLKAIAPSR